MFFITRFYLHGNTIQHAVSMEKCRSSSNSKCEECPSTLSLVMTASIESTSEGQNSNREAIPGTGSLGSLHTSVSISVFALILDAADIPKYLQEACYAHRLAHCVSFHALCLTFTCSSFHPGGSLLSWILPPERLTDSPDASRALQTSPNIVLIYTRV